MSENISIEKAKEVLDGFTEQAEQFIKDPSKMEELLVNLENKLKEVPTIGDSLSRLPLMISMIRSYVTKDYTEVSPKVIVTMISAVIYLLKGKDLIPDKVPVLGYADDIAVFIAAFKLCEPELDAYAAWRETKEETTAETEFTGE
ncbi:MAG: DUF1232 domain-containing protein [Solobacterium sp.]|nr:DUF1232 domain-containing protein [Solobacterium sp.]